MEFQKQYAPEVLAQFEIDSEKAKKQGVEPPRPPASHLRVINTGTSRNQNFSSRFVDAGLVEGWLSITDEVDGRFLRITADCDAGLKPSGFRDANGRAKFETAYEPVELVFTVVRDPGYYCVSAGTKIPISNTAWASSRRGELAAKEAKAWLTNRGLDARDYEVINAYECILDEEQHGRFKKGA